jgi:hypothetical protein
MVQRLERAGGGGQVALQAAQHLGVRPGAQIVQQRALWVGVVLLRMLCVSLGPLGRRLLRGCAARARSRKQMSAGQVQPPPYPDRKEWALSRTPGA